MVDVERLEHDSDPISSRRDFSDSTWVTAPVQGTIGIAWVLGFILSICSSDHPLSSVAHM